MVSPPEEGGLEYAMDKEKNIIISDYNIHNILPPQLNNISARYKKICCCECCIFTKNMHLSLLLWWNFYLKKLKYQMHNAQNRRSVEMASHIFETYNNSVIPYGRHIH